MQITGKQRAARQRNIKVAQASKKKDGAGDKAKSAFKEAYQRVRGYGGSKDAARRIGQTAATRAAPKIGAKKASTYARGVARKKFKISSKSGQKSFASGYTKEMKRQARTYG
jgi:hypothetical protein